MNAIIITDITEAQVQEILALLNRRPVVTQEAVRALCALARGHNPKGLTDDMVGVKYGWAGSSQASTYRTKLSREELAKLT